MDAENKLSVADKLNDLVSTKKDIREAIIFKGVEPEGGMVTYAEAIRKIKGEGGGSCEVDFNDDVVALDVKMDDVDITEEVVSGGNAKIDEVTGELYIKVNEYKSITYIIDPNCDCDTSIYRVPVTHAFVDTLTPHYGYEFDNVVVMMGGENVTDLYFTPETGEVNIPFVIGDITISASVKLKTYTIDNILTHASNNNSDNRITHGDSYVATVTPDSHYSLTKVFVTMGEDVLYDEEWDELDDIDSFEINIPQAVENIKITVESKYVIVVTTNLEGASSDNTQTKFRVGDYYHAWYTSEQYFDFTTQMCSDSTAVISGTLVDPNTRVRKFSIEIASLTDDVIIDVTAERKSYRIVNELTDTSSDNDQTSIYEGESYTANLTPIQWYEVSSVKITEGGRNTTDQRWTDTGDGGTVYIDRVLDIVKITATSTNIVYTVTNNLTGVTTDNDATTALAGQSYYELLTVDYDSYDDVNIIVTMGGEEIDYHNMLNGEINIPVVTGNIVVTAIAITESLAQYNTLDHYTIEDIDKMKSGDSIEVIVASPRIDHGYIIGYDGAESKNYGNGYKNLVRMQHEIAPVSNDDTYKMVLNKTQDTKMEDMYGPVLKSFSVIGSFYNSSITKLTSSIAGYDLYGCPSNFSNGNATRTGSVTIRFNGTQLPRTIYMKAFSSRGDATNYHCYIQYNGNTIVRGSNNQTLTSLSNFTEYSIDSNEITFTIEGRNNSLFTANNVNVWFLVPNNITEIEVIGQREVPDGLPYFQLTTKNGNVSLIDDENLRARGDGFNIFNVEHITSPNQTQGLIINNNPCVFKFSRISDSMLLSSGNNLGPVRFDASESDKTVWYLYKPGTAGYSTSMVSVTNRLTNASTSNQANSVAYGSPYATTFSWDASRTPYRLTVKMNGHDITNGVYNPTTKEVNIPCVIAPLSITVACVDAEDMKKVTYTLNDVAGIINKTGYSESMSTDTYDAVLEGDIYSGQPTFEGLSILSENNFNMEIEPSQYQYMKIIECYADMNGNHYDNIYDEATNTFSIEIEGDCNITITALYVVGYVDNTYYDTDGSSNHIFVETDAVGSGSYELKPTRVGEGIETDYNNITFNI